MTSSPLRRRSPHVSCVAEPRGPWDAARDPHDPGPAGGSPLDGLAAAIADLEQAKRRVLARTRDVAEWAGTAATTGHTQGEWLRLVGRMSGAQVWRYQLLARRLPACPVTAGLLASGRLTVDQAVTIVAGTRRLSGQPLADVEAAAARDAADRNRRGDDPDLDQAVDTLVQQTRTAAQQDRVDRTRLDRNRITVQPDLWGAGRITEDWADAEGFQTRLAAIEHAAGPPAPDSPRGSQLAEGSLATARAWLAGEAAPSSARPTLVVRVDVRDLRNVDPTDPQTLRWLGTGPDAAFGRLVGTGRLTGTPWLGRQLVDTLACNARLTVAVVDGERPLAEFRPTRGLPDRIRRQVLWRDTGCRWPACRAPASHVDVHHLDGDPTRHETDNLVSLCRRHHRRLHSTHWHATLDGHTGRFDLRRSPTGPPVHTTWPNATRPGTTTPATTADPPEVTPTR